MGIISTIFIGFLVGLFARALMPGRDVMGFIMTTLLGIAGAIVGKFIGQAFGLYAADQSAGFLMSLLGAMIVLFVHNLIVRKENSI